MYLKTHLALQSFDLKIYKHHVLLAKAEDVKQFDNF